MLSRPLLFLCLFGTHISNHPHEFMEPRRVLLPLRTIAAPADCTRSLLGSGRNLYVAAAPTWSGTPGLVAQNNKSRLSVAANKSCLKGRTFKIWSCCSAPYGCGQHVCAASTGRVLQPAPGAAVVTIMGKMQIFDAAAPFSEKKSISIYARSTGRESSNRRSKLHQHRITKGSNSTDGGTAVTNPACGRGGTELRLFLSWDLSVSRPTNRQVQSCWQITMRQSEVIRLAGYTARGALAHTPAPRSSTHRPNQP